MATFKLGELIVDFEDNPRGEVNQEAVDTYAQNIEQLEESGIGFKKGWEQRIEVTKDKRVTKGSHTVLALRKKYDENHEVEAFYAKIDGKAAEGKEDAKWLSAQSNKKGINFGDGEIENAINFMLDQMQPTEKSKVKDKRDYISDRSLAPMIGCSRTHVNRIRKRWLKENGFEDVVDDRKTKPEPTEEEVNSAKEAAAKALQELEKEQQKAKTPKKPKTVDDLQEEQDDLNNFDSEEEETNQLLTSDTHPDDATDVLPDDPDADAPDSDGENYDDLDLDDETEDDIPFPDGDEKDRENMRRRHKRQLEEQFDNMIAGQPNPLMFGELEVLINGRDISDKGKIRELLGDKFPAEELDPVIDFFIWLVQSIASECGYDVEE